MGVEIFETWNGDRINLIRAGRRGVRRAAQRLLAITTPRVPVDTGRLVGSGQSRGVGFGADGIGAEVSYDTEYAVFVHEIMDNHHDTGEAKFLENALRDGRAELLAVIGEELRQEMRS